MLIIQVSDVRNVFLCQCQSRYHKYWSQDSKWDLFCVCVLFCVQKALDDKFAAVEEKENEIHLLHLSLREKERDVERLNNLLSHNEETINVRECVYVWDKERIYTGKWCISSHNRFPNFP